MISSKKVYRRRKADLHHEYQGDNFNAETSSVDIVSKEQIAGLGWISEFFENVE